MRILLLNGFVPPSDAPTSRLLEEVGGALKTAGHEVEFLGMSKSYRERTKARSFARRAAGEVGQLISLFWKGLRAPKPDGIVVLSTPPCLPVIAALISRIRRIPMIHWAMDVYPDVAVALGVLSKNSLVARFTKFVMRRA